MYSSPCHHVEHQHDSLSKFLMFIVL